MIRNRAEPGALRLVERDVRLVHQEMTALRRDRLGQADGHRTAAGAGTCVLVDPSGEVEAVPCAPAREDDHELVTTGPVHTALTADNLPQGVGDLPDLHVARGVTASVVDLLQPVKVDREQRERLRRLCPSGDRDAEVVFERAAVSEPGQRVGPGLRGELVDTPLVMALDPTTVAADDPEQ